MAVPGDTIGVVFKAFTKMFDKAVKASGARMAAFQKRIKATGINLQKLEAFALGAGLALLFTGMAIKNAAQQALNATFKTFSEVTEGTMLYNESIGRLSAAFEFLKFSIADAFLTSSLGQGLLEIVINIFDFISGLNPNLRLFIALSLVALVILGGIAMFFGQALLASLGIIAVLKLIGGAVLMKMLIMFGGVLVVIFLIVGAIIGFDTILQHIPVEFKLGFLKALRTIFNVIEALLISPLLMIVGIINAIRQAAGMSTVDIKAKLDKSFLDPKIAELEEEVAIKRAAEAEKESGTGSEAGTTFNIENINANNPEEFVTALKEASLFNKGAGIA
jgi:hypothetical protein